MKTSSISTNVPETLRDVVRKLYSYGFELRQETSQTRNSDRAMRFIRYRELMSHAGGFWWVYQQGEPEERSSQNAG